MLQSLPFDPQTVILLMGILCIAVPLTTWSILFQRESPGMLALWCLGGLMMGLGLLLLGLRNIAPDALTFLTANALLFGSHPLRYAAVCGHRGQPIPWTPMACLLGVAVVGHEAVAVLGEAWRSSYSHLVYAMGAAVVGRAAGALAREKGLRSARLVADCYTLVAAAEFTRFAVIATGMSSSQLLNVSFDAVLALVAALLLALYSNIGYVGMALERAQLRARHRLTELEASRTEGKQAVQESTELRELLAEREEMLRLLAHEVRQPLHNAQAVLQGVEDAVRAEAAVGEAPRERVVRARSVLRQITGGLDNILAASTLLVGQRPTPLRDTDVDILLELCLGDLPPAGRGRVRVVRDADVRTAALDLGLMRLALRNLLNNALAYSVPGSTVTLRVADSDDPLAVVFEVGDGGPGIAPDLLGRIFERGVRGRHDLPGQGLGLYIVRMAMRLQGGTVDVRSGPEGTVFTLSVPQGMEPA